MAAKDAPPAAGARPRALKAGETIGGYRLLERIYVGGMAELWRVARDGLGQAAVMKIPILRDDPTAIVGFEVEQMILPLLSGPHVPHWIGSGGFEEQPFIVMECLDGESLRARLEGLPLPVAEVASIGARIADALHDLHRQHVIHHDLKPSNVMFRADGTAVLIDFGLARHERLPDLLAEQFRLPMGTGPYISPEQVLHDRTDTRSDLFALGVILYFLATGERPFGAPVSARGLRRRLFAEPVPPRRLRPSLPPWLQEVILHCLEVDPARRYASAAQLAFDLSHPDQVVLTARAQALRIQPFWVGWRNAARLAFAHWGRPSPRASISRQLGLAPLLVAAVDLAEEWEALAESLREAAAQALRAAPGARLACVTVLRSSRISLDTIVDEQGVHRHVQRLVQLQHWARPLALAPGRVSFHVLEGSDPADAILDYARHNPVSHILVGSRGASSLRRYLGSVSTKIVAQAPCSVTVVKVPGAEAAPAASSAPQI